MQIKHQHAVREPLRALSLDLPSLAHRRDHDVRLSRHHCRAQAEVIDGPIDTSTTPSRRPREQAHSRWTGRGKHQVAVRPGIPGRRGAHRHRDRQSVAEVARNLGISPYTLHNWVQADRRRAEQSQGPVTEDERAELDRLRAEKARWAKEKTDLEMERDVLNRSVVRWMKDTMNQ